ncbi:ketopantoate reductase family protein, partial [Leclercia adecarboxylata]|uniref:ketopantoate reductase family protein n=1 Tax=Leclercia adecarboxylata TaxID=83655 RepID=UPI00234CA5D6
MLAGVVGQAGFDVEVVARPSTASVINEGGVRLRSKQFGDIDVKVPARTEPTPGSLVVIAAKSYTIPGISDSIAASRPQEIVALCSG